MVRVKVCGLTRIEDVEAAVESGADGVGFVRHPTSPRFVEMHEALRLGQAAGPYVSRSLVYDGSEEPVPTGWVIQARTYRAHLNDGSVRRVLVLPVSPTTTKHDLIEAASYAPLGVEAFLLDTSVDGRTGGTGRTLDWAVAEDFVRTAELPVVLAGGLTPDNVADAVRQVRPYAVDVCSGLESSPGIKDRSKIQDFVAAAKAV